MLSEQKFVRKLVLREKLKKVILIKHQGKGKYKRNIAKLNGVGLRLKHNIIPKENRIVFTLVRIPEEAHDQY